MVSIKGTKGERGVVKRFNQLQSRARGGFGFNKGDKGGEECCKEIQPTAIKS